MRIHASENTQPKTFNSSCKKTSTQQRIELTDQQIPDYKTTSSILSTLKTIKEHINSELSCLQEQIENRKDNTTQLDQLDKTIDNLKQVYKEFFSKLADFLNDNQDTSINRLITKEILEIDAIYSEILNTITSRQDLANLLSHQEFNDRESLKGMIRNISSSYKRDNTNLGDSNSLAQETLRVCTNVASQVSHYFAQGFLLSSIFRLTQNFLGLSTAHTLNICSQSTNLFLRCLQGDSTLSNALHISASSLRLLGSFLSADSSLFQILKSVSDYLPFSGEESDYEQSLLLPATVVTFLVFRHILYREQLSKKPVSRLGNQLVSLFSLVLDVKILINSLKDVVSMVDAREQNANTKNSKQDPLSDRNTGKLWRRAKAIVDKTNQQSLFREWQARRNKISHLSSKTSVDQQNRQLIQEIVHFLENHDSFNTKPSYESDNINNQWSFDILPRAEAKSVPPSINEQTHNLAFELSTLDKIPNETPETNHRIETLSRNLQMLGVNAKNLLKDSERLNDLLDLRDFIAENYQQNEDAHILDNSAENEIFYDARDADSVSDDQEDEIFYDAQSVSNTADDLAIRSHKNRVIRSTTAQSSMDINELKEQLLYNAWLKIEHDGISLDRFEGDRTIIQNALTSLRNLNSSQPKNQNTLETISLEDRGFLQTHFLSELASLNDSSRSNQLLDAVLLEKQYKKLAEKFSKLLAQKLKDENRPVGQLDINSEIPLKITIQNTEDGFTHQEYKSVNLLTLIDTYATYVETNNVDVRLLCFSERDSKAVVLKLPKLRKSFYKSITSKEKSLNKATEKTLNIAWKKEIERKGYTPLDFTGHQSIAQSAIGRVTSKINASSKNRKKLSQLKYIKSNLERYLEALHLRNAQNNYIDHQLKTKANEILSSVTQNQPRLLRNIKADNQIVCKLLLNNKAYYTSFEVLSYMTGKYRAVIESFSRNIEQKNRDNDSLEVVLLWPRGTTEAFKNAIDSESNSTLIDYENQLISSTMSDINNIINQAYQSFSETYQGLPNEINGAAVEQKALEIIEQNYSTSPHNTDATSDTTEATDPQLLKKETIKQGISLLLDATDSALLTDKKPDIDYLLRALALYENMDSEQLENFSFTPLSCIMLRYQNTYKTATLEELLDGSYRYNFDEAINSPSEIEIIYPRTMDERTQTLLQNTIKTDTKDQKNHYTTIVVNDLKSKAFSVLSSNGKMPYWFKDESDLINALNVSYENQLSKTNKHSKTSIALLNLKIGVLQKIANPISKAWSIDSMYSKKTKSNIDSFLNMLMNYTQDSKIDLDLDLDLDLNRKVMVSFGVNENNLPFNFFTLRQIFSSEFLSSIRSDDHKSIVIHWPDSMTDPFIDNFELAMSSGLFYLQLDAYERGTVNENPLSYYLEENGQHTKSGFNFQHEKDNIVSALMTKLPDQRELLLNYNRTFSRIKRNKRQNSSKFDYNFLGFNSNTFLNQNDLKSSVLEMYIENELALIRRAFGIEFTKDTMLVARVEHNHKADFVAMDLWTSFTLNYAKLDDLSISIIWPKSFTEELIARLKEITDDCQYIHSEQTGFKRIHENYQKALLKEKLKQHTRENSALGGIHLFSNTQLSDFSDTELRTVLHFFRKSNTKLNPCANNIQNWLSHILLVNHLRKKLNAHEYDKGSVDSIEWMKVATVKTQAETLFKQALENYGLDTNLPLSTTAICVSVEKNDGNSEQLLHFYPYQLGRLLDTNFKLEDLFESNNEQLLAVQTGDLAYFSNSENTPQHIEKNRNFSAFISHLSTTGYLLKAKTPLTEHVSKSVAKNLLTYHVLQIYSNGGLYTEQTILQAVDHALSYVNDENGNAQIEDCGRHTQCLEDVQHIITEEGNRLLNELQNANFTIPSVNQESVTLLDQVHQQLRVSEDTDSVFSGNYTVALPELEKIQQSEQVGTNFDNEILIYAAQLIDNLSNNTTESTYKTPILAIRPENSDSSSMMSIEPLAKAVLQTYQQRRFGFDQHDSYQAYFPKELLQTDLLDRVTNGLDQLNEQLKETIIQQNHLNHALEVVSDKLKSPNIYIASILMDVLLNAYPEEDLMALNVSLNDTVTYQYSYLELGHEEEGIPRIEHHEVTLLDWLTHYSKNPCQGANVGKRFEKCEIINIKNNDGVLYPEPVVNAIINDFPEDVQTQYTAYIKASSNLNEVKESFKLIHERALKLRVGNDLSQVKMLSLSIPDVGSTFSLFFRIYTGGIGATTVHNIPLSYVYLLPDGEHDTVIFSNNGQFLRVKNELLRENPNNPTIKTWLLDQMTPIQKHVFDQSYHYAMDSNNLDIIINKTTDVNENALQQLADDLVLNMDIQSLSKKEAFFHRIANFMDEYALAVSLTFFAANPAVGTMLSLSAAMGPDLMRAAFLADTESQAVANIQTSVTKGAIDLAVSLGLQAVKPAFKKIASLYLAKLYRGKLSSIDTLFPKAVENALLRNSDFSSSSSLSSSSGSSTSSRIFINSGEGFQINNNANLGSRSLSSDSSYQSYYSAHSRLSDTSSTTSWRTASSGTSWKTASSGDSWHTARSNLDLTGHDMMIGDPSSLVAKAIQKTALQEVKLNGHSNMPTILSGRGSGRDGRNTRKNTGAIPKNTNPTSPRSLPRPPLQLPREIMANAFYSMQREYIDPKTNIAYDILVNSRYSYSGDNIITIPVNVQNANKVLDIITTTNPHYSAKKIILLGHGSMSLPPFVLQDGYSIQFAVPHGSLAVGPSLNTDMWIPIIQYTKENYYTKISTDEIAIKSFLAKTQEPYPISDATLNTNFPNIQRSQLENVRKLVPYRHGPIRYYQENFDQLNLDRLIKLTGSDTLGECGNYHLITNQVQSLDDAYALNQLYRQSAQQVDEELATAIRQQDGKDLFDIGIVSVKTHSANPLVHRISLESITHELQDKYDVFVFPACRVCRYSGHNCLPYPRDTPVKNVRSRRSTSKTQQEKSTIVLEFYLGHMDKIHGKTIIVHPIDTYIYEGVLNGTGPLIKYKLTEEQNYEYYNQTSSVDRFPQLNNFSSEEDNLS